MKDDFVELLDFCFKTSALPLSHLPQVVFCFSLLILGVNQSLGVEKFLVDILEMLLEDLLSLEVFLELLVDLLDVALLLSDLPKEYNTNSKSFLFSSLPNSGNSSSSSDSTASGSYGTSAPSLSLSI